MLTYKLFVLGPLDNNAAVLYDDESLEAAIIDPSYDPQSLIDFIQQKDLRAEKVLLTHGHFDHYYGLPDVQSVLPEAKEVYLHADDLGLWREGGAAKKFMNEALQLPDPNHVFHGEPEIRLGTHAIQVFETPGHTPGSVVYYCQEIGTAFCGDLIFYHGVGRTDLAASGFVELAKSIRSKIYMLPAETVLIAGHGKETNVAEEMRHNPFVR